MCNQSNIHLGQETEGKLPESCVNGFQSLLISTNFNPIHVSFSLLFDHQIEIDDSVVQSNASTSRSN